MLAFKSYTAAVSSRTESLDSRRKLDTWLAIAVLVVPGFQPAKAITWDGNGSPNQSSDWSIGANWDSDTSPIAGESAVLGNVSAGTRIISYDPAANGALGTLVFDQFSAGTTNELRIIKDLTVTNGITLGTLAGTERITVGSSAGATYSLTPGGGLTLNPGGELVLTATGNGGTSYNFGNLAGNNLTINIAGGTLKIGQITGTSSGTTAQNSINGNLTMSGGALAIENSPGISDRRLQIGGNVNITGGVISTTRVGAGGSLMMSGITNYLNPASFDPDLAIQLDRPSDQTLTTNATLGSVTLRGSGVKTLTSTANARSIDAVVFIDGDNTTPSSATTLKLGADLTLTLSSTTSNPSFSSSNQVSQSGRIDGSIDTNGFILDLTKAGTNSFGVNSGHWRPNEGPSSTTNAVWNLSGAGTIKATYFDFASPDVTVNVAAGTTLLAEGGSTNDLGDAGGDLGAIAPTSTFRYAGGTATTLTSNRPIGNLEVISGALIFRGPGEVKGNTTIRNGELSLTYSFGITSMLSDSAVLRLGLSTLKLTGNAIDENVGSTTLDGAANIIRPSGSTVLNMGGITVIPGGSMNLSASGIAKTTNANDAYGMLGTWASISGSDWATNDSGTIVTFSNYTDVSRTDSGSQIIADGPTSNVRLVEGTGALGNISLGANTTTVHTLNQSSSGGTSMATIDLPNKTLAVDSILSGTSAGSLTIGTAPGSGMLSSATAGGTMEFFNYGLSPLTVNSTIVNHTTASNLAIGGTGTTTLSAANSFTGKTFLNNGKLILASESSLGPASTSFTPDQLTINGGTLFCPANSSLSDANRGITLTESGGTFETVATPSGEFTIASIISGPGKLKAGPGVLTLNGNNTYSGGTILADGGTLKLGHSNAMGSGDLIISDFCELHLSGDITITNNVDFRFSAENPISLFVSSLSGSNTIDSDIALLQSGSRPRASGALYFTNEAEPESTLTLGGTITGDLFFIKLRGSGSSSEPRSGTFNARVNAPNTLLEIDGDTDWTIGSTGNDWYKTSLWRGTGYMIVGIDNALDTSAFVAWNNGSPNSLDLNGYDQTVAGITTATVVGSGGITNRGNSDSTLTLQGLTVDRNFAGTIRDGATHRVHLVMNSPNRTQTLSGSITYTGETTINGGTLALGVTTAFSDSSTIRINGATSILKLGSGVTDVVNALVIDGDMKAPGTWGTTASTATYKDDIHFSGTGVLQVVPYTAWANSFGLEDPWLGVNAALNGDRSADPDNDGLTNFQEFAFGLLPTSGASLTPIVIPLNQATGIFNYTRRKPSLTGLRYSYVYSTSIVGEWPSFTPVSENSDQGDPVETITVAVPKSLLTSQKLFIRVLAW